MTKTFALSLPEALGQHRACDQGNLWVSVSKSKHRRPKAARAPLPGAFCARLCNFPAQPCSGLARCPVPIPEGLLAPKPPLAPQYPLRPQYPLAPPISPTSPSTVTPLSTPISPGTFHHHPAIPRHPDTHQHPDIPQHPSPGPRHPPAAVGIAVTVARRWQGGEGSPGQVSSSFPSAMSPLRSWHTLLLLKMERLKAGKVFPPVLRKAAQCPCREWPCRVPREPGLSPSRALAAGAGGCKAQSTVLRPPSPWPPDLSIRDEPSPMARAGVRGQRCHPVPRPRLTPGEFPAFSCHLHRAKVMS